MAICFWFDSFLGKLCLSKTTRVHGWGRWLRGGGGQGHSWPYRGYACWELLQCGSFWAPLHRIFGIHGAAGRGARGRRRAFRGQPRAGLREVFVFLNDPFPEWAAVMGWAVDPSAFLEPFPRYKPPQMSRRVRPKSTGECVASLKISNRSCLIPAKQATT